MPNVRSSILKPPLLRWAFAIAAAIVLLVPLVQRDFFQRRTTGNGESARTVIYGGERVAFEESGSAAPTLLLTARHLFVFPLGPGKPVKPRALEILNTNGQVTATLAWPAQPHAVHGWRFDVGRWTGAKARLLPGSEGPVDLARIDVYTSAHPAGVMRLSWAGRSNYLVFAYATLLIAALIWLPGLAWRTAFRLPHSPSDGWWLPLPGLLLLSGTGLVLWLTKSASSDLWARVYLGTHVLLALFIGARGKFSSASNTVARDSLFGYGCLCLGTLILSVVQQPVAYEGFPGVSLHAHTVMTSGDHTIPYVTAAYFYSGRDGREESDRYFSREWSVASRGPLPSWAIVSLFNALGVPPPDPLGPSTSAYPAASEGFFVARIFGVLSNALIVFAAVRLLLALGEATASQTRLCIAWLVLAPSVICNTLFVWPKLLAAYFILLAAAEIAAGRRPFAIGVWCALAWLCHPVGALFVPPLGLFFLWLEWPRIRTADGAAAWSNLVMDVAKIGAGVAVLITPWLAYKFWLGAPDVFLSYPLGDGHGFARATSVVTWLQSRWDNLVYTLVPGAYIASEHARQWFDLPVTSGARWVVQAMKTLPAGFGLVMVPLAVFAFFRPATRAARASQICLLGFSLSLMLLYWGYSSDGLGRTALEPFIVLFVTTLVASLDLRHRWQRISIRVLAIESALLSILAFSSAPSFRLEQMPDSARLLLLVGVATLAAPVLIFRIRPGDARRVVEN